jgi:hypothetical protein
LKDDEILLKVSAAGGLLFFSCSRTILIQPSVPLRRNPVEWF